MEFNVQPFLNSRTIDLSLAQFNRSSLGSIFKFIYQYYPYHLPHNMYVKIVLWNYHIGKGLYFIVILLLWIHIFYSLGWISFSSRSYHDLPLLHNNLSLPLFVCRISFSSLANMHIMDGQIVHNSYIYKYIDSLHKYCMAHCLYHVLVALMNHTSIPHLHTSKTC